MVVWDRVPSHRAEEVLGELLATKRVFLPSYSPELNPAERGSSRRCVRRRRVEGKVYEDLEAAKRRESESYLEELRAALPSGLGACTAGGGLGKRSNRAADARGEPL